MQLSIRCLIKILPCPVRHSALRSSRLIRVRPRRLNATSARTFRTHRVHAEAAEEQWGYHRLPSVQKQATEHRKRVLSKVGKPGMLFIMVRLCLEPV